MPRIPRARLSSEKLAHGRLGSAELRSIDGSVGLRVRQRRVSLSLSQHEVAAVMGLSFQQLQKYERGTNRISASRLIQLGMILKVPVAFFFEEVRALSHSDAGIQFEAESDPLQAMMLKKKTFELVAAFHGLRGEAVRSAFVRLLESMTPRTAKGS